MAWKADNRKKRGREKRMIKIPRLQKEIKEGYRFRKLNYGGRGEVQI
jgi:hypothetical protein